DGDYALTATVQRGATTSSDATAYKVYSSDSTAPTLFWPNPWDGAVLSGKSYNVVASSNDDHAVQRIELSIDGVLRTRTACDDVACTCQLSDKWSLSRVAHGQHTLVFTSCDWTGHVSSLPVTFTVG